MSVIKVITGLELAEARHALTWFAKQAEEVQVEIIEKKNNDLAKILASCPRYESCQAELAALIMAIRHLGWDDEQAFRSSKGVSVDAAQNIKRRRQAKSKEYLGRNRKINVWLRKHWGIVMELRRANLSWLAVAEFVRVEHGIKISHTTFRNFAERWHGC